MDRDLKSQILEQLIDPLSRCLTPEVARKVVDLRANDVAQFRVTELAEKSNEGVITPEERREYETYVLAGNFIAILQAKARRFLMTQSAA